MRGILEETFERSETLREASTERSEVFLVASTERSEVNPSLQTFARLLPCPTNLLGDSKGLPLCAVFFFYRS